MDRDVIDITDIILMTADPPLLGAAVGLLLSLNRRRPALAALGGAAGGAAGAWAGVVACRMYLTPAYVQFLDLAGSGLICLLLASIPPAWCLAGSKVAEARREAVSGRPGCGVGCGVAFVGVVLASLGLISYLFGCERDYFVGTPPEMKSLGGLASLGGSFVIVAGVVAVRRRRDRRRGPPSPGDGTAFD